MKDEIDIAVELLAFEAIDARETLEPELVGRSNLK